MIKNTYFQAKIPSMGAILALESRLEAGGRYGHGHNDDESIDTTTTLFTASGDALPTAPPIEEDRVPGNVTPTSVDACTGTEDAKPWFRFWP